MMHISRNVRLKLKQHQSQIGQKIKSKNDQIKIWLQSGRYKEEVKIEIRKSKVLQETYDFYKLLLTRKK